MKNVAPWVLVALMSGCGRGTPVPVDTYYRLAPPRVGAVLTQPLTPGALYVAPIRGDSLYRERPLLYSEDAANLTVRQYHHHYWEDAPPRLLRQQLVQYLRDARAAGSVTYDADADAALSVRGRIDRFEHILAGGTVTAHVILDLRLLDRKGRSLLAKDYHVDRPAAAADVISVVAAIDAAVNEIFDQFLNDARRASAGAGSVP